MNYASKISVQIYNFGFKRLKSEKNLKYDKIWQWSIIWKCSVNWQRICSSGIPFMAQKYYHGTEKYKRLVPWHRNIFEILLNQSEIRLYLPFSDWFRSKQTSAWFQISRKMVNTIWFRFDLIRFKKYFSVCNYPETSVIISQLRALWNRSNHHSTIT